MVFIITTSQDETNNTEILNPNFQYKYFNYLKMP